MSDERTDAPAEYVVCTKDHYYPEQSTRIAPASEDDDPDAEPIVWEVGQLVPKGSRWHADDPTVKAAPRNFKKEPTS